jgi:hypothetical protein
MTRNISIISRTLLIQNALAILFGFAPATANAALVTNSFDGFLHGTVLRDQLAAQGAIFSSPSAENAPTVYGFFPSPVSRPNYLIGENEGEIDLNQAVNLATIAQPSRSQSRSLTPGIVPCLVPRALSPFGMYL